MEGPPIDPRDYVRRLLEAYRATPGTSGEGDRGGPGAAGPDSETRGGAVRGLGSVRRELRGGRCSVRPGPAGPGFLNEAAPGKLSTPPSPNGPASSRSARCT